MTASITYRRGPNGPLGPQVHKILSDRALQHGLTLNALCRRVGLAPNVPVRWKTRGSTPSLGTYLLLTAELEQLDLDRKEMTP